MGKYINVISAFAVPLVIFSIIANGLWKNVNVYLAFTEGAKEGIRIGWEIVPSVVGLLFAIGMFRQSGALEILVNIIKPVTDFLKVPYDIVPFALMRPVSGSGSLAMATDIFRTCGTDSFAGRVVSVMMGSTETTFYTLAVYFGATKVTDTGYAMKCSLIGDIAGILLSVWVCRAFFG